MVRYLKFYILFGLCMLLITACYIEGGGCNGPVCFGVSTDICDGSLCDNSDDSGSQCPDADDIQVHSLAAINSARSSNSRCGISRPLPLNPVQWNRELFSAADLHSLDMASNNFISPLGSDGLGLTDRLSGVSFSYAAQSVAGGFSQADELIGRWLADGQECNKILNGAVSEVAMACRYDNDSQYGTYWTLVMTGP